MNVNVFFVFFYIFTNFLFCEMHNKYCEYEKKLINRFYCEVLRNESLDHE